MDCFVGASTGALKGISFQDGVFHNMNTISELNPKSHEITCMCWTGESQTELLTAQLNRQLRLYDTKNNYSSLLFDVPGGTGSINGIYMTKNNNIVAAAESGELRIWNAGEVVSEMNAGNNLLVMVPDANDENRCATGGNENPLKIWDLEKSEKVFTAKNVPPDNLQLRVPIWENDIRFLPDSRTIATATGKCQLRLYDPRAQRRPVKEFKWLEEPITAMSLCNSPHQLVAGNSRGDLGLFDIRNKMSLVCKYKGFAGSVRGIAAHPTSPYIASCSIDRFVCLHDLNTRKLLKKIYCKVRLNKILMRDELSLLNNEEKKEKEMYENDWKTIEEIGDEGSSGSVSGSEEDEALWNDMKQVRDSEKRKHDEVVEAKNDGKSVKKSKMEGTKRKQDAEEIIEDVKSKKRRIKKLKRKWEEGTEGKESSRPLPT